jgi:hypothetical protein
VSPVQREVYGVNVGLAFVAILIAVIIFAVVALGGDLFGMTQLETVALGLALFAVGHILP